MSIANTKLASGAGHSSGPIRKVRTSKRSWFWFLFGQHLTRRESAYQRCSLREPASDFLLLAPWEGTFGKSFGSKCTGLLLRYSSLLPQVSNKTVSQGSECNVSMMCRSLFEIRAPRPRIFLCHLAMAARSPGALCYGLPPKWEKGTARNTTTHTPK